MVRGSVQHLFGAFQVETQIAPASVAELFLEMQAAVLAVGVWPEVEHGCPSDVAQTADHLVEGFAAIRFSGQHVDAARGTDDVFVTEPTALGADTFDFLCDDRIDPVVVAGQDGMSESVQSLWELLHDLFSLLVRLGRVEGTRKQNADLATAVFLGSPKSQLR